MGVDETSLDRIRNATFPTARRGYDKQEVEKFLGRLADWLETGAGDETRSDTVKRELEKVASAPARSWLRPRRALSRSGPRPRRRRVGRSTPPISRRRRPEARRTSTRPRRGPQRTRTPTRPGRPPRRRRPQRGPRPSARCARRSRQPRLRRAGSWRTEQRREDIEAVIADLARRRDDV